MTQPASTRVRGFNGLRGCCITLVYLAHKCDLRFYAGHLAVWCFLALSGFLMIGQLHKQRQRIEADAYGIATGLRIFFTKRALRIVPAYYGVLAILFALRHFYAWAGPDLGFRYHVFYLSNVWVRFAEPMESSPFGVLWTLSVEQQFYLVAAFAFLLAPSRFHLRICIAAAVLAAAGHLQMIADGVGPLAIFVTSPWNFAIIALGGAAGLMLRKPGVATAMRGPLPLGICLACMAAYGASWLVYQTDYNLQPLQFFGVTLTLVGLVAWVCVNQDSRIVRGLEWRPIAYLGVVSYGFYLIHNFVPNPLGRLLPLYFGLAVSPAVKMTLGAAIGFVISFTLAHLSWTYCELPLRRMRDRLLPPATGAGANIGRIEPLSRGAGVATP